MGLFELSHHCSMINHNLTYKHSFQGVYSMFIGLKVSLSLVTGVMTTVGGIFNILAGVFYTLDPIFPDSIGTGISRFQPHPDSNFPVPDLTGSLRSLLGNYYSHFLHFRSRHFYTISVFGRLSGDSQHSGRPR